MEREQVQAALDAITEEQVTLDERLEVLRTRFELLCQLLTTFGEAPAAPLLAQAFANAEPPAERKPRTPPGHSEEVTCPDCGQRMRRGGLGPHRSRKHKDSAAKPVEVPEPTPKPLEIVKAPEPTPEPPRVGDTRPSTRTVYRCSEIDCGEEVDTLVEVVEHVTSQHGRRPTHGERILVTPDAARASA